MSAHTGYTHAIVLTEGEVNAWAGRVLTADERDRLAECIPHSSIPEAVATIVDSFDAVPGTEGQDRKSYSDTQDRDSYAVDETYTRGGQTYTPDDDGTLTLIDDQGNTYTRR
jgi:hypothetical protein